MKPSPSIILAAAVCLASSWAINGWAATTVWQTLGTGNWVDGGNWSGGVPGAGDDAQINTNGTALVNSGDSAVASNLTMAVDRFAANQGSLTLSGGSLAIGQNEIIGNRQLGTFTQTGGTHAVGGNLTLGNEQHAGLGYVGVGVYSMSGNSTLSVGGSLIVGNQNAATFTMSSGSVAANSLILGNSQGAQAGFDRVFIQSGGTNTVNSLTLGPTYTSNRSRYEISGGLLQVNGNAIVANLMSAGDRIIQTGGTVSIATNLILGSVGNFSQVGTGSYEIGAGSLTVGGLMQVGRTWAGIVTNSGGTVQLGSLGIGIQGFSPPGTEHRYVQTAGATTVTGDINLGGGIYQGQGPLGKLSIQEGTFTGTNLNVGISSMGEVNLSGGTANFSGNIRLGTHAHPGTSSAGNGTLNLTGGTLNLGAASDVRVGAATIWEGGGPVRGTLNLGDASGTTVITGGRNLTVRDTANYTPDAYGVVRGWGVMPFSGALVNNGRVIADGYGAPRTLDLSSFSSVNNTTNNPVVGGTNGWFAVNRGRLELPALSITGSGTTNWGESTASSIDLVNSARITLNGVSGSGSLSIALLATNRTDIPDQVRLGNPVGVWDLAASGFSFSTADVTFRYDDAAAAGLGVIEGDLQVFHFTGGKWTNVTTSIDTANHRITVTGLTSFSDFFIGTHVIPEPSLLALLALGSLAFVARRRPLDARARKH